MWGVWREFASKYISSPAYQRYVLRVLVPYKTFWDSDNTDSNMIILPKTPGRIIKDKGTKGEYSEGYAAWGTISETVGAHSSVAHDPSHDATYLVRNNYVERFQDLEAWRQVLKLR